MPAINYARLVKLFAQKDALEAADILRESMSARDADGRRRSPDIDPRNIDLGRLFTECFGWGNFLAVRNREVLANQVMEQALTEAEGAVASNAFLNITGQIVYATTLDAYMAEDFVFSRLIPEEPAMILDGEKIAGITQIGNEIQVRNEADPYALAGVGENWIRSPAIRDRGMIVPVTWEAVFQDRTGHLLQRCGEVGYWFGYDREVRAIDCVIDENATAHRYNWRDVVIATYGDNSGTHSWDNLAASNALVDWTDIDAAEQVFNALVDPYTGAPILFDPRHLVVTKQLEQTARRIVSATEIRVTTPGYATSGNPTQTVAANPYGNKYEVVTSRLLASRLATDTDWFISDISKLAACKVAEKMSVMQAPSNNKDEFERRIVNQFRVNGRDAYYVREPRASVKNTA